MVVLNIRLKKRNIIYVIIAVAVLLLIFFMFKGSGANTLGKSPNLNGATDEQRTAFLKSYDLNVSNAPVSTRDVIIPFNFDKVYEKYNQIQLSQGFDLKTHSGDRATRYTYEVLNYPNAKSKVYANLLIVDNKIIGGDVSSVELNGFMHGFKIPSAEEGTAGQTAPAKQ